MQAGDHISGLTKFANPLDCVRAVGKWQVFDLGQLLVYHMCICSLAFNALIAYNHSHHTKASQFINS